VIHHLIWDFDGTLFDTYPAITRALSETLNDVGSSAPLDWIEGLTKKSLDHCVSTLVNEFNISEEEVISGFRQHYGSIPPQDQPPFPGVIDICEYVCSVGGTNVIVTHRGRESTTRLLSAHNMARYFADCLARDDDYPRKPDPAAFEAMIEKHGFRREETLAIGDRDMDILAGQAAGIRTCLFGTGPNDVAADFTITDYAELHRLIAAEHDASGLDSTQPSVQ
jgi:phosphoglycolate phosphatase-like HAD superfamily hydrolase